MAEMTPYVVVVNRTAWTVSVQHPEMLTFEEAQQLACWILYILDPDGTATDKLLQDFYQERRREQ